MDIVDEKLPPLPSPVPTTVRIILPSAKQQISATAAHLAELMAGRNYYRRGPDVVRVVAYEKGHHMEPLGVQLLRSEAEQLGELVRWSKSNEKDATSGGLAPARMKSDDAVALLAAVHQRLPRIRSVVNFPPLHVDGRIQSGQFDGLTGLFCAGSVEIPEVNLNEAILLLGVAGLLRDFQFQTPADGSRLMAAILAPGLRFGPWAQSLAPFPMILTEADKSQSGKGFASEMIAVLYGEHMANVTQQGKGGVGSFDEKIQSELLKGRPLICLDNLRGSLNSTMLESFMTARGPFPLRAFFREGETDSRAHLLFATSNGVQMSEDLENRCLIVRIRKQAENYPWHQWPDCGVTGNLLEHLAVRRAVYLGAVYAVIRCWIEAGMPTTRTTHSFRETVGVLNWMVTRVFGWPDVMDGHNQIQQRQANPVLGFLREFVQAAGSGDYYASDFLEGAEEHGLSLPEAVEKRPDIEGRPKALGRLLASVFKEREIVSLDDWRIERVRKPRIGGGGGELKIYRVSRNDPVQAVFPLPE